MAVAVLLGMSAVAQQTEGPTDTGYMQGPVSVPSLAQQMANGTFIEAPNDVREQIINPKRQAGNRAIPGKGFPKEGEIDPQLQLQQNAPLQRVAPPLQTFETMTSTPFTPTDPTGAVGPNHYVAAWNTSFRIFDKAGNPQTPVASLATLFGATIGDPIVFYDAAADRFVITQFDNSPNGFNVAVCQGSDPVNDGWHIYNTTFNTGQFPDYTKFAVWGDVYMVTANIFGTSNRVFAVERNEMLDGDPAQFVALPLPGIATNGFYSPHALHTTADELAPPGTPVPILYLQDDQWGGVSEDHVKIWNAEIDWANPSNSTITLDQEITTTPFIGTFDGGNFANLPQPGTGQLIDAGQAIVFNQPQYRRFGTYNSAVFCFVVDTDPGSAKLAGIRWYEIRQTGDGQPWTIFQEGTYVSPNNNRNAFYASMAMNANGDIGMGYSTVSSTENVAIRYTGRLSTDPPNVMMAAEELIGQGTNNITGTARYADYTHLTVDPVDQTFWHVGEYLAPNRRNIVGQFAITPPQPNDIGVISIDEPVNGNLTNAEDITITIRNFGSNNITNPEVQYTIDGGTPVVENFSGTINAGDTAPFTFATQADLSTPGSYVIAAKTNLAGDSNTNNDEATKTVNNTASNYCIPEALQGCNIDGIKRFVLNTIDADDGGNGCNTEPAGSPQGYADRTALSTVLSNQAGSNDYVLQAQMNWGAGVGVEALSVWIDFDDSDSFEASERLISGEFFTVANALDSFDLLIPAGAALGSHRMRVKAIDTSAGGDILNPCSDFDFGEVQDYTVEIDDILSVNNPTIEEANLVVASLPNNQFKVSLNTSFDGIAYIQVVNTLGQVVVFNNLERKGNGYEYDLDMSYAASGVYIIQMGDQRSNTYQTAKIIVK